jgi:nucleoside-diphosphate-sugar epimerase
MATVDAMKTLLAFGLGYSAAVLAARLRQDGWTVIGTGITPASLTRIAAAGFQPLRFDSETDNSGIPEAIAAATGILVSIPPGADGDPVLARHAGDLADAPNLAWAGYLSTVGVYGDHNGGWVEETTPPHPVSQRSKERLAAEEGWLRLSRQQGVPVQIFRLSGIYGPGRNAVERLQEGEKQRIVKPGQVFNRIHVEDIARTLAAAIARIEDGDPALLTDPVFNVTDDEPAPPQDVTEFAAKLLGIEPPPLIPFDSAALSPMARSFYGENKRVRNVRIKRDLGVKLLYPTYREGLSAIAASFKR